MIEPNMATMLAFIVTDLDATHASLQKCLSKANAQTFNCISIDGDMSTNDTVILPLMENLAHLLMKIPY